MRAARSPDRTQTTAGPISHQRPIAPTQPGRGANQTPEPSAPPIRRCVRTVCRMRAVGPLYDLIEASDRATALAEARRIVRPGGVVVATAISRFASLMDGLKRSVKPDRRRMGRAVRGRTHLRHPARSRSIGSPPTSRSSRSASRSSPTAVARIACSPTTRSAYCADVGA